MCVKLLSMEPVAIPYKRMFMYTKPINALDQLYTISFRRIIDVGFNKYVCICMARTVSPLGPPRHHPNSNIKPRSTIIIIIIATLYRENHIVLFLYADLPMLHCLSIRYNFPLRLLVCRNTNIKLKCATENMPVFIHARQ